MGDDTAGPWYHDDRTRFLDALNFTAATTGFSARLIEKDYFCSLVLHDLNALFDQGLIFKGGTCLSKVHAEFFRISEDLDFCISIRPDASRADRRRASMPFRDHLTALPIRHALFALADAIDGHNDSRQYNGRFAYRSVVTGGPEHIKVELSLREDTVLPTETLTARTLLRDPHSPTPVLPSLRVRALHLKEAYAEKIRAALTRRDPAIRDFFDIGHALRLALFELHEQAMGELIAAKLAVAGNAPVDLSDAKIATLLLQLETDLKPVLKTADYDAFDLEGVISLLKEFNRLQQSR
jgi:predicted nucleotidyltransferase component of viral defense system